MPRPPELDPLFRSLRSIKGIGPQLAALLTRFFGAPEGQEAIALDLLMHMPSGMVDRRRMEGVANTYFGHVATLKLHIDRHQPPPRGKPHLPHRVFAHDETGDIQLVFFRQQGRLGGEGAAGRRGALRLRARSASSRATSRSPIPTTSSSPTSSRPCRWSQPVYPLTHGLAAKVLNKLTRQVLDSLPELPEWIPAARMEHFGWPTFRDAMRLVHTPASPEDVDVAGPARMRLAYDEYLAGQLALMIVRSQMVAARGIARTFTGDDHREGRARPALLADRRDSRRRSTTSARDLASPDRMSRLVQGDVGSGKTVVALMAMAAMAEVRRAVVADGADRAAGRAALPDAEAALRCGRPQHHAGDRQADRRAEARGGWRPSPRGEVQIVVGTHALFQSGIEFHNLGLTVVDEQHRFGVHQRLALSRQGRAHRPPGDDRDADPAHAGAHPLRRHGGQRPAREAGGPAADRHGGAAHHASTTASSRGCRRALPRARRRSG